mgnify:CR=1 FL=1
MNSGPGKENVLTPLLKQLMPENAMNGASGSDSVYLRSADSGITEINATGRYNWTKTSYCPVEPR